MTERYEIGWSSKVGKDLAGIKSYLIENSSEATATKITKGLVQIVHTLEEQPERYPIYIPLKKHGNFRYIIKWNFRIVYEFTGHQIIVHRIIHTKRSYKVRKS
jgi:plasmid stabilization system protein ParE